MGWGGYSREFLMGICCPVPDPISEQKMSFSASVFRPEGGHKTNIHVYKYRNYIIITEIRTPTKDFSF